MPLLILHRTRKIFSPSSEHGCEGKYIKGWEAEKGCSVSTRELETQHPEVLNGKKKVTAVPRTEHNQSIS